MVQYSLQSSKNGIIERMSNRWLRDFKKMMWNVGEKVTFDNSDNTQTEIRTIAGYHQGQRIWKYKTYHPRYGIVDEGQIVEN